MGDVTLRPIEPDELARFVTTTDVAFGFEPPPAHIDEEALVVEHDRTIAAVDDGTLVGTAAAYSMALTLPGPVSGPSDALPDVPVAAVTGVGVLPTHHRRGVLTAMMARQLDDVAERGEPAAVLLASEASIYRRFGYGVASAQESLRLAVAHAATVDRAPERRMRLVPQAEAAPLLAGAFDAARRARPGMLSRTEAWWGTILGPATTWRGPGRSWVVVAHDPDAPDDADPMGYAVYVVRHTGHPGDWTVDVHELTAADAATEAALWAYVTSIDLTAVVELPTRPVDEAHRLRLVDPRRLVTTARADGLWLRPVDVAALLSVRGYAGAGRLVLDVTDPFAARTADRTGTPCRFDAAGRYVLEAGADGHGTCVRVGEPADPSPPPDGPADVPPADLACSVAELGAAVLGGTSWTALAAAGRVHEHRPDALRRADALFATSPAPFCSTKF